MAQSVVTTTPQHLESVDQVTALLAQSRRDLIEAESVQDFAAVAKRSGAIAYLTKAAGLSLEAANAAQRLKVEAEWRAGALLRERDLSGNRYSGSTLQPLGVDKFSSHRWQDMANVPFDVISADMTTQEEKRAEITSAKYQHMGARLRRMEAIHNRDETLEEIPIEERPVSVIYADPPWHYDFAVSDARQIENQYPTMRLADICAVDPVPAEDAILFMWTTSPKLRESFDVVDAWGFTYKTSMVWVKPQMGMGYYARQQHELLLIATLGHLPVPEPDVRPSSVIDGRRTKHSAKPDLRPMLDAMYPGLWKREMFSRRPAEGLWLVHGNDAVLA